MPKAKQKRSCSPKPGTSKTISARKIYKAGDIRALIEQDSDSDDDSDQRMSYVESETEIESTEDTDDEHMSDMETETQTENDTDTGMTPICNQHQLHGSGSNFELWRFFSSEYVGVRNAGTIDDDTSAVDIFSLLVDDSLLQILIDMTNLHAAQHKVQKPNDQQKAWIFVWNPWIP